MGIKTFDHNRASPTKNRVAASLVRSAGNSDDDSGDGNGKDARQGTTTTTKRYNIKTKSNIEGERKDIPSWLPIGFEGGGIACCMCGTKPCCCKSF